MGVAEALYSKCRKAAEVARGTGVDIYAIALAIEFDKRVDEAKKRLSRSKSSVRKIDDDKSRLFIVAFEALDKSYGLITPEDAAEKVMSTYLSSGMDVENTAKITRTPGFAIRK